MFALAAVFKRVVIGFAILYPSLTCSFPVAMSCFWERDPFVFVIAKVLSTL